MGSENALEIKAWHKPTTRATKGGGEERSTAARHPPSIGVLGSGRLANTTSTYSSCSRSSDAFRPAAPAAPALSGVRALHPREAAGAAQLGPGASSARRAALPSMMCFRDRPLSVSALGKQRWVRPGAPRLHCHRGGRYLLSSPEDFGGDDQAGPSVWRKKVTGSGTRRAPARPVCVLPASRTRRGVVVAGFTAQEQPSLPPAFLLDDVAQHHLGPAREWGSAPAPRLLQPRGRNAVAGKSDHNCGKKQPAGMAPVPGRLRGKRGGLRDAGSPLLWHRAELLPEAHARFWFLSGCVGTPRCLGAACCAGEGAWLR